MPRAGSSTLQEVLFHYRNQLEPHGLLYPVISAVDADSDSPSRIYNHKLLYQSAQGIWRGSRFARLHDSIGRQIAESPAPLAVLSYEGWWDPNHIPSLRRTIRQITRHVPAMEITIVAVVREPAAFMLSLYKLDLLHGRTDALLEDYWPGKLADPRLRYGRIATALKNAFSDVRMLDFETLSRDGQLVGNVLAAIGAPGILSQAGVPVLEAHRSKGGDLFADAPVSMALFAARHLGLKRIRAKRQAVMDCVMQLCGRKDLASFTGALSIPLPPAACVAIRDATRDQTEMFARLTGLNLPEAQPKGRGTQSVIDAQSPLGEVLLAELSRLH